MSKSALNRRNFMTGLGAAGMAGVLAACSGGDAQAPTAPGAGGGGDGTLRWWDHLGGLRDVHTEWAQRIGEEIGMSIEYSYNEPGAHSEALQLANQSNQLPDAFSPILDLPLPALVEAGWAHELTISDEAVARLPEGSFVEGLTMLDGKIYAMPTSTGHQYIACTWFNTDIQEEVGFDAPHSYQEFIDALEMIDAHGEYSPMTIALGAKGRMREQIDDLAQAAGFPGSQGLRYDTGEYDYSHDAYITAIELYKEIYDRGLILPGSNNFQIPDARGRWAAGNIGFHIDGPYSPGGVRSLNPDALPTMGVAGMLTPEGEDVISTKGAPWGGMIVSGKTQHPEEASRLLESFTERDYQVQLALGMDAPPIVLDAVAEADVIEPYAWLIEDYQERVFRGPQAIVRNPEIAKAEARRVPVSTELGDVIQGYLGGELSDLRAELVKLSDSWSQTRENAVEAAVDQDGAEVELSDWEFPDWERGVDYTY